MTVRWLGEALAATGTRTTQQADVEERGRGGASLTEEAPTPIGPARGQMQDHDCGCNGARRRKIAPLPRRARRSDRAHTSKIEKGETQRHTTVQVLQHMASDRGVRSTRQLFSFAARFHAFLWG